MIPGESSAYVINHTTVDHLFMRGNTASDTDGQGEAQGIRGAK